MSTCITCGSDWHIQNGGKCPICQKIEKMQSRLSEAVEIILVLAKNRPCLICKAYLQIDKDWNYIHKPDCRLKRFLDGESK